MSTQIGWCDMGFAIYLLAVADLGFPRGGGANSPGGGAPAYDFAKISQNLHEIERIWTPGGAARPKFYYVDPPLISLDCSLKICQFLADESTRLGNKFPLHKERLRLNLRYVVYS